MLRILAIKCNQFISSDDTGDALFKRDPDFVFRVEAPMYWWLDCEFERFYLDFSKDNLRFCLDAWDKTKYDFTFNVGLSDRQLMQILPLSTIIEANITLSYKRIIKICEDYQCGEYCYPSINRWPTEREWKDFCETLLDLRGVRDIVEV